MKLLMATLLGVGMEDGNVIWLALVLWVGNRERVILCHYKLLSLFPVSNIGVLLGTESTIFVLTDVLPFGLFSD